MKYAGAMRHASFILGVALVGCISEPEPDATEAVHAATPVPPEPDDLAYDRDQGQFILGSTPDKYWPGKASYFRIESDQTAFTLAVPSAGPRGTLGTHLEGTEAGITYKQNHSWFNNKELAAETGERIRITSSKQIIANGIVSTLYFLEIEEVTSNGTEWVDYCGPAGDGALPLHGYFDRRRKHVADDAYISFSCRDGTARKCNSFGYPGGNNGNLPGDRDNWDYHQACLGMTSALYCGDGRVHTRELTPVQIRDAKPNYGDESGVALTSPVSGLGNLDAFYIEAAWRRDGRAFCIRRSRWNSLPPRHCGTGPTDLLDPRFTDSDSVKFCDDYTQAMLLAEPGVVLVNGSQLMDAGLHRWKNPSTGDTVVTIRALYSDRDGDGRADDTTQYPLSAGYTRWEGMEGLLLRNLPKSLLTTQMSSIYLNDLSSATDLYLTNVGPGRSSARFEGYVFKASRTMTVTPIPEAVNADPFTLCKSGGNHDNDVGQPNCVASLQQPLGFALPPLPALPQLP